MLTKFGGGGGTFYIEFKASRKHETLITII